MGSAGEPMVCKLHGLLIAENDNPFMLVDHSTPCGVNDLAIIPAKVPGRRAIYVYVHVSLQCWSIADANLHNDAWLHGYIM
jgi:hypothetical protein